MKKCVVTLLITLATHASLSSQIMITGSPYLEDFDTLGFSGSSVSWTDGITVPGWYANRTTYSASTGSSTGGSLYSYGASANTERAFGSLATASATPIQFGVRLRNDTGSMVDHFTLSYTGEQWRLGSASSVNNTLTAAYKLGATTLTEAGFVDLPLLSFNSIHDSGTALALNGNTPINRVAISGTVSGISWPHGTDLWLRWTDTDNIGSDHGLAIDDLTVSPVPEPGEYGLIAGLALVAFATARHLKLLKAAPAKSTTRDALR